MKPMTVGDYRRNRIALGLALVKTVEETEATLGDQPHWAIRNTATALSIHTWRNTPQDWRRLEAALIVLPQKRRGGTDGRRCHSRRLRPI